MSSFVPMFIVVSAENILMKRSVGMYAKGYWVN